MPNWTADRRLYLTEEGRVTDNESEPGRKTLLAAQGRAVPEEVCRQYGLGPYAENAEVEDSDDEADGEESAEPEAHHRHRWRVDGTCRCGAVKSEGE